MDEVSSCPLEPAVTSTARSRKRLFHLVFESHDGVATIPVGRSPKRVAISRDAKRAYVTNFLGSGGVSTVSVIDTATNTVSATVPVGTQAEGIAITPDGKQLYVANFASGTVSVIDTATNTEKATVVLGDPIGIAITADVVGAPMGIAITPDGKSVYVTNPKIPDATTGMKVCSMKHRPAQYGAQASVIRPQSAEAAQRVARH